MGISPGTVQTMINAELIKDQGDRVKIVRSGSTVTTVTKFLLNYSIFGFIL